MKSFHETYDMRDPAQVQDLIGKVSEAHTALQNLEAGAEPTKLQQAEATFMFLSMIGFYPESVKYNGVSRPVLGQSLMSDEGDEKFSVVFKFADTDESSTPVSMFGSMMRNTSTTMMPEQVILYLIDLSFPGIVIQCTEGTAKDGSKVYHITARPDFMQPKSYKGFPVESGSAICSSKEVALMQAFIRMLALHLVGQQWANGVQEIGELEQLVDEQDGMVDSLFEIIDSYEQAEKLTKLAKLRDEFEKVVVEQKQAYMADHGAHPLAEMAWDLSVAQTRYNLFGVVK